MGSEYLDNVELSKIFSKVVSENLTPLLPSIKKNTLIVWGGKDQTTPMYYAQLMKKLIPKSRLIVFENAGHFSFVDEPTKFIEALTEFV
jgi:pimeloyl-ACP methyl ester carboxylesterase